MHNLWFFLHLFKPYKNWLIAAVFLSTLTSLSAVALLTLSGWFISAAAIAGVVAIDGVAISFNFLQPAAIIRALAIIRTLGRYSERLITHNVTFKALAEIRLWFFKQLIPLATGRLSRLKSGDLLSRITNDINALDALYLRLLIPITVAIFGLSILLSFLYYYAPLISYSTALLLIISAVLIPFLSNFFGRNNAAHIVQLSAEFKMRQIEVLQSLNEIIVFKVYPQFQQKLENISKKLLTAQTNNNRLSALSASASFFLSQLALLAALLLAAHLMQQQELEGAEMALLVFCVLAAFELVAPLPLALQMLGHTKHAAKRIKDVADLEPIIKEPENAKKLPLENNLRLDKLSFRYHKKSPWIFKNLSLKIPHGSKIALVGDSGAGKTTFLHLLLRFFDTEEGQVTLSGINYKKFDSDKLLTRFALLSQHSQLFSGTIKNNLLIGKKNATTEEINLAINAAGLELFINQLPEGLNTWIGEQGENVSGGEARRIALARVYLKNAPIILLDEPTEGLDVETTEDLLRRLSKISKDKTLIIVTHKLDVLQLAKTIYKLKDGQIVEIKRNERSA